MSILNKVKPPTGEPDAGDPHVRFGGRGGCECILPYPYQVVNLPSKKKFTTWIPAFAGMTFLVEMQYVHSHIPACRWPESRTTT